MAVWYISEGRVGQKQILTIKYTDVHWCTPRYTGVPYNVHPCTVGGREGAGQIFKNT